MDWQENAKKLNEYGYDADSIKKIGEAFQYAHTIHEKEKRYSGDPYIDHPVEVSLSIAKLKLDASTVAAALLHDVVENQGVPIETLKKRFGEEVAFLVDGVTKVDK